MTPFLFASKIDDALKQLDRIPLYGNAPRLDLHHLSSALSSQLNLPLTLSIQDASWRTSSNVREELGKQLLSVPVAIHPLHGEALWLMSRQDAARLTSWFFQKNKALHSDLLEEGFFWYFALKVLEMLQEEVPFKEFTLRLKEEESPAIENAYCMDLKISSEDRSCFGRLVLPNSFLTSWERHFSSFTALTSFPSLSKNLEVPVGIHIGSVLLSQEDWKAVNLGDVLLLDRGSYDPRHKEGIASLSLGATPLFHVKIKENGLKLLEPALFYEEDMDKRETPPELNEPPVEEGPALAVKELPLFITVELARLRMTVDQLMKLAPGNFLELPIRPEQGVLLTVNAQKVARGEIVYLGEALGIRILEIAE